MVSRLGHRGPDGSGVHVFDDCILGHTRLSVVDLDTGEQPMLSASADVGVTFNGEVYGYKTIRAAMPEYPFRTKSDTEVLLALYHRHGRSLPEKLPGMFSFALWDDGARELFCARDRFGEKPFYYAWGAKGEFLFASEIKALLASGLVAPVLDEEAVAHYMKYLYVHPHRSIYRNVHVLPPAHFLRHAEGRIRVERYWKLPATDSKIDLSEAVGRFRMLFEQAVSRQLVADVPVGAFLSGGLDSSTIVAVASRFCPKLQTYSFAFEDSTSELPFAREVADLYRTEHVELTDDTVDIAELLVAMQQVYDEPFADSSNIPTYLISRLAREHAKVILTGDGGDELLAGYAWYRPLLESGKDEENAGFPGGPSGLAFVLDRWFGIRRGTWGRARRPLSTAEAHLARRALFGDAELARLGLRHPSADRWKAPGDPSPDDVDGALRMDLTDYMPGDILVKIDRASMANGLELRAPFLDVDFASFCISLPYRLKINDQEDKIILRHAYSYSWPEPVRVRPKQGFGGPVDRWLERDSLKALKEKTLNDPGHKLFSLLSFQDTRRIAEENNYRTWTLLVLALWMDAHRFEMRR
jgi:asparagine synthase (glutamine-hydrolysing)